ncbi:hypothetical protein QEG98_30380 [Myxococcus sp. MxC21-1]|nr:hypothetical protein [Myxococcus sp. MxC21-1]WNZ60279.1 hypothetical protein QEG98_30380 [Myxococcus sp. MxC21-1]
MPSDAGAFPDARFATSADSAAYSPSWPGPTSAMWYQNQYPALKMMDVHRMNSHQLGRWLSCSSMPS